MLANISGNNSFAGSIGFGNAGSGSGTGFNRINIVAGSLEIDGLLAKSQGTATNTVRTIDKEGPGDLIIGGNNAAVSDPSTINASASAFAADTPLQINKGRVVLRSQLSDGANTGNLPGTIDVNVGSGAALVLDNSQGINAGTANPSNPSPSNPVGTPRLSSSNIVNLTSVGSELIGVGNTLGGTISVPSLNINSSGIVTMQGAAPGVSELDLPGFDSNHTRINRSTVLLRGIGGASPTGNIKFVNIPAIVGGGGSGATNTQISILPSAVGDTNVAGTGSDFVTVDQSTGIVSPLTASQYKPLASGNAANDNTTASGIVNLGAAITQTNSIKMSGGTTISIGSGKQLWVFSGAILGTGTAGTSITGGRLSFENYYPAGTQDTNQPLLIFTPGAFATNPLSATPGNPAMGITDGPMTSNEGVITVPTGGTLTQDASNVMAGGQGLTKSGGGTLQLFGTNLFGASKAYGRLTTTEGEFGDPESAVSGSPLTIDAGRLEFNVDVNLGDAASPVVLNGGTLAPLMSSTGTRGINLATTSTNTIDVAPSASYSTSGLVIGNALTKMGNGVLGLTNTANTYTGGTFVNAGTFAISAATGSRRDRLPPRSPSRMPPRCSSPMAMAVSHPIILSNATTAGATFDTQTNTVTFNGDITNANVISGTGNLVKVGTGTLVLGVQSTQNNWSGKSALSTTALSNMSTVEPAARRRPAVCN